LHDIIDLNGTNPSRDGNGTPSNAFTGEVHLIAGDVAPGGWAFCDGQVLKMSQGPNRFVVVGSRFGGNGTTTFALPDLRDLRDRAAVGASQGTRLTNRALGGRLARTLLHFCAYRAREGSGATAQPP
jgi:microcystin-dependent protein